MCSSCVALPAPSPLCLCRDEAALGGRMCPHQRVSANLLLMWDRQRLVTSQVEQEEVQEALNAEMDQGREERA